MATLFPKHVFEGFGPTPSIPAGFAALLGRVRSRDAKKLRQGVREHGPKLPGVYGMLGRHGDLIYVGKAKSLRHRLMSYFRESRDPKAGRILDHTHTLIWETVPDEFGALVRELELIRQHRPRFNVLGQPGHRRYTYVCLGRSPAPYAYVARQPTGRELAIYGPLTSSHLAWEACRRLNDWYRLRDCSQSQKMHFAEQGELFPQERTPGCLRFDIGTCSAPCAGGCRRDQYAGQIREAKAFLDGRDKKPLVELTRQMTEAAVAMQFERAASLRDRLRDLQWLSDRLTWLRSARSDNTFVYPINQATGPAVWYLIHRGRVAATCHAPTRKPERRSVSQLLTKVFETDITPYVPAQQVDHILLVSAWLRKHPEEQAGIISVAAAKKLCE
ncbi:UvrB/UvrC motif-containing protein [Zavarzinella formosa]|uniref:UvrB/UvrC motif-containing protein n=1 Tax=Zavarzinella formosa TaxID=360055 RepID=UPI0003150E5D|nr:UvrB/UvrC motif-containing protein [Zavarzinella formosa]